MWRLCMKERQSVCFFSKINVQITWGTFRLLGLSHWGYLNGLGLPGSKFSVQFESENQIAFG